MKYRIEHLEEDIDHEVIIRCHHEDKPIKNLIDFLEDSRFTLIGEVEHEHHILNMDKVYYIESVDNQVYIYDREKVFKSKKRLYELEEELEPYDFFRASKSLIINIKKIELVRPLFDGRFEANLKNGEKVIISRKYVSELKKKLGL